MDQTIKGNNNNNFELEFQQLKAYYNFRLHFKKKLKEVNSNEYDENKYYLIDKKWLQNWKIHVGYNYVSEMINNNSNEIDNNDFKNYFSLLQVCSYQNRIGPLDNKNIYNNKSINPLSDFVIVNKDCYYSFNSQKNLSQEKIESFSLVFFKGNYLLKLNPKQFLLTFKIVIKDKDGKDNEIHRDLILTIIEGLEEKNIINHLTYLPDLLEWLK